jgi:formylglycine-generating enzyme required for sulfatase activity
MSWRRRAGILFAAMLAMPASTARCAAGPAVPSLALQLQVEENTQDGCAECGCRVQGALPSPGGAFWIAYGLARAAADGGWAAAGATSYCGSGAFGAVSAAFHETIGFPYAVLDLKITRPAGAADDAPLGIAVTARKLAGFDRKGHPRFEESSEKRSVAPDGEIILPVLIPDGIESGAFAVHEVLLRIRATRLGRGNPAGYGTVRVSSDVPGAVIRIDGSVAGRVEDERPATVTNILAGERTISVTDFSGREARRQIRLAPGQAIDVDLHPQNRLAADPKSGLLPIGRNPQGYDEYWRPRDGAIVVAIPGGAFERGTDDAKEEPDQRPARQIFVSGFLIDKTEVTWRQFRKFAADRGQPLPPAPLWGSPEDYAVTPILWKEAAAYCAWVGGRLPTEAEWEKAARGSDGRIYPWGNDWDGGICNSRDGGPHRPESVGEFPGCVSPYGVLEMHGGVWEWCSDFYDPGYYSVAPHREPQGPATGTTRVLRGGSWMTPSFSLKGSMRFKSDPEWRNTQYGFRCVQESGR